MFNNTGSNAMAGFLARRFIQGAFALFGVLTLVFLLIRVNSDPATFFVRLEPDKTAEELRAEYLAIRKKLGLDQPIYVQYVKFMSEAIQGDFGSSFRFGLPASEAVLERVPRSLQLAGAAVLIAIVVGLPLGIFAALRRGTALDTVSTTTAILGLTIPSFWLGMMLIMLLSVQFKLLPPTGSEGIKALIMPAVTQSAYLMAVIARMGRSGMLEVLGQDYVRTARAKGVPERTVISKHALRNAAISLITVTVSSLPAMIGTVVVVEVVFRWPGIGSMLYQSVGSRDYPVVLFCTFMLSAITIAAFIFMDILYALVDPRIRHS